MIRTIEKVYDEGFYFNKKVSKEVMWSLFNNNKLEYLVTEKILTEREIEVLKLICDGKMYKEVAEELKITMDTVKYHVKFIHKKTQIDSIAHLVKYAIKVGITGLD